HVGELLLSPATRSWSATQVNDGCCSLPRDAAQDGTGERAREQDQGKRNWSFGLGGGGALRLCRPYPHVEVVHVTAEPQQGQVMSKLYPNLRGFVDQTMI